MKSSTHGNKSCSMIQWPENTLHQIKLEVPSMLWAKSLKLSDNFIINSIHIAKLGQHAHRLTGVDT